jgi:AraC-like DNA-binding protein
MAKPRKKSAYNPMKNSPKGLLSNQHRPITIQRHEVEGPLSRFLEYYWSVHWQLPEGETFTSTNIPFPCTHIVYERGATGVFGQVRGSFEKTLRGDGFVLGARFKSGYFYPFSNIPADQLTDQSLDLDQLFNTASKEIDADISAEGTVTFAIEKLGELLNSRLGSVNEKVLIKSEKIHRWIQWIEHNSDVTRVEALLAHAQISERQLERLFKTYIGLSPKWVIRLFRLQQLADRLVSEESFHWSELAQTLGYFDQAHCLNDFKRFTGKSPSSFL